MADGLKFRDGEIETIADILLALREVMGIVRPLVGATGSGTMVRFLEVEAALERAAGPEDGTNRANVVDCVLRAMDIYNRWHGKDLAAEARAGGNFDPALTDEQVLIICYARAVCVAGVRLVVTNVGDPFFRDVLFQQMADAMQKTLASSEGALSTLTPQGSA